MNRCRCIHWKDGVPCCRDRPMGAPGSPAKTWKCSCGCVNNKLGACASGCGTGRTVTPPNEGPAPMWHELEARVERLEQLVQMLFNRGPV